MRKNEGNDGKRRKRDKKKWNVRKWERRESREEKKKCEMQGKEGKRLLR